MSKRKSPEQIATIKNAVLDNIRKLGFTIENKSELGKSIYALNGNTIIDLITQALMKQVKNTFLELKKINFIMLIKTTEIIFKFLFVKTQNKYFLFLYRL